MAYLAFTVYGGPFQNLLLASEISNLMQDDGSILPSNAEDSMEIPESCAWLIYLSQPLITFVYQLIHLAINQMENVNKVWAVPRSLATTTGIVVYFLFLGVLRCFSSPAYRYLILYIQTSATQILLCMRFPHSDIPGSKLVRQLPEAYRSHLRPSSVSYVKASFMCA